MRTDQILEAINAESATIPDIRELLGYIHAAFGGTAAYAKIVVDDLKNAPSGSPQRLSFHNSYLGSVAKFGGNDDLGDLDPEALEEEAKRIQSAMEGEDGD